jgi:tetratricopeptide (TPR) repeat protein
MAENSFLIKNLRTQGEALVRAKRLQEARDLYQQLCRLDETDADAWFVLGAINGQLADHKAAEDCSYKVIALRPEEAEPYFNLGISLRDQKRLPEALDSFRTAIRLKPDDAKIHNAIGFVLARQSQIKDAERYFRQAIAINPHFADAYINLGNLQGIQKHHEEALACYHKAIEIQPDNISAMLNLVGELGPKKKLEEMIEWDRRILALRPDFATVHHHLGNVLIAANKVEEALECYRNALNIKPDFIEAAGAIAQTLQKLGRFDESSKFILPAFERGLKNAAILVAYSNVAKHLGQQEQAIKFIEEMLRQDGLSGKDKLELHFAAGKLHDDIGRYDLAFEHCRLANDLYQTQFHWSEHVKAVDSSITFFRLERMRRLPRAQVVSERPIFIVGMPRSGTSLVEQILASHPSIYGAGELNELNRFANSMQKNLGSAFPYPDCIERATQTTVDSLAKQYLDQLLGLNKEALRVTDKMPHNFLHLGMISMLFPGARIIHVMREPMDVCLSIYFQKFNDLHAYANNLTSLGHYYRTYEKLMTHWRSVIDLPMLDVQYEKLVANPETWIPRLLEFCGVEWNDQCLRFHETERPVNTPSNEQVRQPMYSRSVDRWRNYESQLEPLKIALGERI